jgi:hypothetical protein
MSDRTMALFCLVISMLLGFIGTTLRDEQMVRCGMFWALLAIWWKLPRQEGG